MGGFKVGAFVRTRATNDGENYQKQQLRFSFLASLKVLSTLNYFETAGEPRQSPRYRYKRLRLPASLSELMPGRAVGLWGGTSLVLT